MVGMVGRYIAATAFGLLAGVATASAAQPSPRMAQEAEFAAFLERVRHAQAEYVQSRPAAFKALWSQGRDVTLFGGFGSGEHGWDKVGPRLDWASTQFTEGTRTHETLESHVAESVAYVVQLEKIRFKAKERSEETTLELRATMIFRRESAGWRIVHRHADSQIERQPPR